MEAEDTETKMAMSTWNKLLGLLYMNPTQTVWDSIKRAAKGADLVWPQASKAIDLQGVVFLANTNGNDELVRNNILRYLIINNGLDNSSVEALKNLSKQKIAPKGLFHVETAKE
jgi:hypothetical protein